MASVDVEVVQKVPEVDPELVSDMLNENKVQEKSAGQR